MNKIYKRGKISSLNLFLILCVSRLVFLMTYAQSLSYGKIKNDIIISIVLSYAVTALAALPAVLCVAKGKNPLKIKILSRFYFFYIAYIASVEAARFSYFSSVHVNRQSNNFLFAVLIVAACAYGAFLGIESLGRFSPLCAFSLGAGIVLLALFNFRNFDYLNFFPIVENETPEIVKNALRFSSNSSEIVLLLALSQKVNGKCTKPVYGALGISMASSLFVMSMAIGVLGGYISTQPFPVYALSQMANIQNFGRLDAVHTAVWILAAFLKLACLIYSCALCLKFKSHKLACAFSAVFVLIFSTVFGKLLFEMQSNMATTALFAVFCIVVPIFALIVKKRNYGDELLENY